jgi:IS30 family transposase
MRKYKRISAYERELILKYIQQEKSYREIARILKRSPSSISREVKRNTRHGCIPYHGYSLWAGEWFTYKRAASRRKGKGKLTSNQKLRTLVLKKLRKRWSPAQISNYLKNKYPKDPEMQVSHESIYTYIYVLGRGQLKEDLRKYLRQSRRFRRRKTSRKNRGKIPDMISIEERPAEVEDRSVPGHWEGDLLIGKGHQSALGTLVERTTRFLLLVPLKAKDMKTVRKAFARKVKRLPRELRRSLTYDQGREMAEHKLFTQSTEMKVLFAHPHSPWERGTNENTNMLIRDFLPKDTDFREISRYKIKKIQDLLNERPRKVLDWESPEKEFSQLLNDYG